MTNVNLFQLAFTDNHVMTINIYLQLDMVAVHITYFVQLFHNRDYISNNNI